MSVFDDEIAGDLPGIFADAGDAADYQGQGFTVEQLQAVIERDFVIYDQDQLPQRVVAIEVQVADVPRSHQGDTVVTLADDWRDKRLWAYDDYWSQAPKRTWTVQQILEDDGLIRRLYVTG